MFKILNASECIENLLKAMKLSLKHLDIQLNY